MREMMFYVLNLACESLAREFAMQFFGNAAPFGTVAQALKYQTKTRTMHRHIGDLARQICAIIAVDGNVRHVREAQSCFLQTVGDCMGGKASPVLDTAKALLFGAGDKIAFPQKAGSRIWGDRS